MSSNVKYTVQSRINTGAAGVAWLIHDEENNKYAMKTLEISTDLTEKECEAINREAAAMRNLDNPNVVKYHSLVQVVVDGAQISLIAINTVRVEEKIQSKNHEHYELIFEYADGSTKSYKHNCFVDKIGLILEYADGGTLRDKIDGAKTEKRTISAVDIRKWMLQIADAVEYIHKQKQMHRDLKPENIFLTSRGSIKVGDFGLSLQTEERSAVRKGFAGTFFYVAPEVFNDEEYSYRCDLWSLGVILYELITLKQPFSNEDDIMECQYETPEKTAGDETLRTCVKLLLNLNPRERPRAGEIGKILGGPGRLLDIVFVVDYTASMQAYIDETEEIIGDTVKDVMYLDGLCYTRVALVKYRDHPPEDSTFVTKTYDFTRDIDEVKKALGTDEADGGGDGPEAVVDALHELTKLTWRPTSHRVAVLILDAPPHGCGGLGDGFPDGCPCGLDPVKVCRALKNMDIKLYIFGCSTFIHIPDYIRIMDHRDLLCGLAHLTGGKFKYLHEASLLKNLTFESTLEAIKAPTTEVEVRELLEKIKPTCVVNGKLDEKLFVERVCEEFNKKCYTFRESTLKGKSVRIGYRGAYLSNCNSLAEMLAQIEKLNMNDANIERSPVNITTEKVKQYLTKFKYIGIPSTAEHPVAEEPKTGKSDDN